MIHEFTSIRASHKRLSIESKGDHELFITILDDDVTSDQIHISAAELKAALVPDDDPALVKRLSKLAESWTFTSQGERRELLAAMNSFELPHEYGAIVKGKKNSYDLRFLVFTYTGEGEWHLLGGGETWADVDILSGLHDLALVQTGYDYESFERLRRGDSEEEK